MKESTAYEASDYAGIEVPSRSVKLYYGYEVTDANKDWCFQSSFTDVNVTIPFSALKQFDASLDQFECTRCLLAGIAILIESGNLKL
jgi:hypothetical protein